MAKTRLAQFGIGVAKYLGFVAKTETDEVAAVAGSYEDARRETMRELAKQRLQALQQSLAEDELNRQLGIELRDAEKKAQIKRQRISDEEALLMMLL